MEMNEFYKVCLSYKDYDYREVFYSCLAYGNAYWADVVVPVNHPGQDVLADLLKRQLILAYRVGIPTEAGVGPIFAFDNAGSVRRFASITRINYLSTFDPKVRSFILRGHGEVFEGDCPSRVYAPRDWKRRNGKIVSAREFVGTCCPGGTQLLKSFTPIEVIKNWQPQD